MKKVPQDPIALSYEDYLKDKSTVIYMLPEVHTQIWKHSSWYKDNIAHRTLYKGLDETCMYVYNNLCL